jgi:hypothetical protein
MPRDFANPLSTAALAGASAGVALWCTRGVLDLVAAPAGPVRVAMLPPVWQLVLLVALTLVGVVALAHALTVVEEREAGEPNRSRGASHTQLISPRAADTMRPLFGSLLLALPYLPWLPEVAPALVVLAGPLRDLVWFVVLAQVGAASARLVWPAIRRQAAGVAEWRGSARFVSAHLAPSLVFLATLAALGLAASRVTGTPVFPGGDEPHYLIIAQSLWRDGDLRIENNHARGDYREYFTREHDLAPHYLTRGVDGEIYSVHPIGLPVLLAPVYALGGYRASVAFMALVAALAAALMWRWVRARTASAPAATLAWAGAALGAPYVFNGIAIYPEIVAGLCATAALVAATSPRALDAASWRWLIVGVAVAALPWLSTKYAPMAAALIVVALGRVWWSAPAGAMRARGLATLAVLLPFALSLAAWFWFFYAIWGTPLPTAPYGAQRETQLAYLRAGGPGLFFDQEFGVLAYAPALALGLAGLVAMWRAGGGTRREAAEIAAVFSALLVTVGAFHIWWGGAAAPGRPIASGLLLLGLPIAWTVVRVRAPALRAAYLLLVLIGLGVTATLAGAQGGLLLAADRDGSARLLEWLSPSRHVWAAAPSFIAHPPIVALGFSLVWVAAALLGAWALSRRRPGGGSLDAEQPGRAALLALLVVAGSTMLAAATVARVFAPWMPPPVVVEERPRSPLLEQFDAARRPIAVRFDPLRLMAAHEVLPWLALGARDVGPARGRQAAPHRAAPALLLNARFSLPAGRYAVRARADHTLPAPVRGTLALQVGRIGPPLVEWRAELAAGMTWRHEIALPIDANFVGLRGSGPIIDAVTELWFEPLALRDAHARGPRLQVLAARRYGSLTAYFHDDNAWAEPAGFWTRGGSTTRVTVVADAGEGEAVFRMHCGPAANQVTLRRGRQEEGFDIAPGAVRHVALGGGEPVPVTVSTTSGFVPADVEPDSTDLRTLGCRFDPTPDRASDSP